MKPLSPQHSVEWIDHGREPEHPANPDYPNGVVIDGGRGAGEACYIELDYPARRCGLYIVTCLKCGYRAGVTTAGRRDDPRAITLPCQLERSKSNGR